MPDTSIHDNDFRKNAEEKARTLELDSFLIWNVSVAHLFVRKPGSVEYTLARAWEDLADISERKSVIVHRNRWEQLASEILGYINDLLEGDAIRGRPFIESYQNGAITDLIMANAGMVEHALIENAKRNELLRSEIDVWFSRYQAEYKKDDMMLVLARAVIANWIGKILFAHILRERDSRARRVNGIGEETTPEQALELFQNLSEVCDFWTIFSPSRPLSVIPEKTWHEIKQFNFLLMQLRVGSLDQNQLGVILESTADVSRRRLRGQYVTPKPLANLLVHLCLRDIISDRLLDPCCGSGTIARGALDTKLAAGVSPQDALASVFAGDQDPQAVQIATFALTQPVFMNHPLRVFERDAFSLTPQMELEFRDPSDGTPFRECLGQFHAIVCNLPFVSQNGRMHYQDGIKKVNALLNCNGLRLSGRADVAAYLPFALHSLLVDGGRLGIIITNAWMGTRWGDDFRKALDVYFGLFQIPSGYAT